MGVRDVKSKRAGRRRHGLSHRVDDQELHGDVDPEASRRGQAVARRSRRALRSGAEEPPLSDDGLAADHDPPSADAFRRLSRRQPVGRSAARRKPRPSCRACCASGIPFSNAPGTAYEYSNYGFAILGRIVSRVSGQPYDDYVDAEHPAAARHDVDDAASVEGRRRTGSRIGYRWEDERWKEEPALPHGSFGAMGGMLTIDPRSEPLRRARFSTRGRRATVPRRGPISRASLREMQQPWRPSGMRVVLDKSTSADAPRRRAATATARASRRRVSIRAIVAHSGGLPGYGSLMRWLPDYGVGIIAFGNVTYTGWGNAVGSAIDRLDRTGGLRPTRGPCHRRRSSRRATTSRSSWCAGTTRWRTRSPPRTCSWIDRRIDGARRSRSCVAKVGACTAPDVVRHRRERAARAVDDELRARGAAGGDHAGADDAAGRAVPGDSTAARAAAGPRALRVVLGGTGLKAQGSSKTLDYLVEDLA